MSLPCYLCRDYVPLYCRQCMNERLREAVADAYEQGYCDALEDVGLAHAEEPVTPEPSAALAHAWLLACPAPGREQEPE